MPSLMACTHSRFDPASRFRLLQFVPRLEAAGWQVSHRPNRPWRHWQSKARPRPLRSLHQRAGGALQRLSRRRDVNDAATFDAVFVNRDLLGIDLVWERRLLAANPRVLFDFDDAIHLGDRRAHVEWICRHAAAVTAGSPALAEVARGFGAEVTLLPTVVEMARYRPRPPGLVPARPRVGWLGSDSSIRQTLVPHLPMLARLQRRLGFELVVVSKPRPDLPEQLEWRYVEWSETVEGAIAGLFEIGIMPLQDDAFQRAKCGTKLLEYMAAGLPVVASPVGVNRTLVPQSGAGFLASDEAEWGAALEALLADAALRDRLGTTGRDYCAAHYSVDRWFPVLLGILDAVSRGAAPHGRPGAPP
jgi:glycosyltransferase involved in cell wall biosynthesis